MELNEKQLQAIYDYVEVMSPHRSKKQLLDQKYFYTSTTIQKASIEEDKFKLAQAYIKDLIGEGGDFFDAVNLDTLQGFDKMVGKLKTKYKFRYNMLLNQVEYKMKGNHPWELCNDNNLKVYLQRNKVAFKDNALSSWLGSEEIEAYHPLHEYFEALPQWDGEDHIQALCKYISIVKPELNTETDYEAFFYDMFKKHLIRMLQQAFDGTENRYVFVLQSEKENLGKTHFLRWLNPLPSEYHYELSGSFNVDKDIKVPLARVFMCIIDEIEISQRNESNLKNLISTKEFNVRLPYDKTNTILKRTASFFATCNHREFLGNDKNTRFLAFSVDDINHDYDNYITGVKNVDKKQLWAQVYQLYKEGVQCKLSREEQSIQLAQNEEFQNTLLPVGFLLRNYRVIDPKEAFEDPSIRRNLITTYDFITAFKEIHHGYTDSKIGKDLATYRTDEGVPILKKRIRRHGVQENVYNIISK